MSEPRTEAGKALLRNIKGWDAGERPDHEAFALGAVVAIEAEVTRALLAAVRERVDRLDDPWPVEGARDDDPRDDWCCVRDVLAILDGLDS